MMVNEHTNETGRSNAVDTPGRASASKAQAAMTHADYARYAHMDDEQILRACEVETFHASGPGGQGVNTADSAVRMRHAPTGVTVTARAERSQLLNRQACLRKLRAEFERRAARPKARKKTRVPHRAKERRLAAKHATSMKKLMRGRVRGDE